jgi:hypothetical protein
MFEPEGQRTYLGVSVPLSDAIRAKYAGVVMDTAWALLEIGMQRDPQADPNRLWAEITERYLRIRPHPRAVLVGAARSTDQPAPATC